MNLMHALLSDKKTASNTEKNLLTQTSI